MHLRQHYHFGPLKISMYLKRYHEIEISQSGVWRILKRLEMNRLSSSQRHKPHEKRWKRYEKQQPGHRIQMDVKFIEPLSRFLADLDPDLTSLDGLDRQRHIEPFLNSTAKAISMASGEPVTVADQARRILAVEHMLSEISEWGWDNASSRRLIFRSDHPRLPKPLPRYLPVDADRRLTEALEESDYRLAADALLLARAVGLRIGELLDLELDCVHEIVGHGSWLKVPLGKLDTERMVPLDDETVVLIDRITTTRSTGRPLPHTRTRRPTQFLFTHHGRRLSQNAVRAELARSAQTARIGHVTPHQLRHTYATALVSAGVSLQALMASSATCQPR